MVVVVVVVGVVIVVTVVVGALGLDVVDAMVVGALGGGRLGSFDEVGVGASLGEAVDVEIRAGPSVAPTIPLPSSAVGLALVSVVVGPTTPTSGSAVYGTAPTGPGVVLGGEVRSAPVSSSQPGPQGSPWLTSAKAPMKSRAIVIEIAETRTARRSRQRRFGREMACPTVLRSVSVPTVVLRS
jgi:hypothetical protein